MTNGWIRNNLGNVTTKIGSGATPLGGEDAYKTEGISLIRSLNVHDDGFRVARLARIDDVQADRLSNVVVEPGDVLLNITGASIARCCLAPIEFLPARVNQHVSIVRPVHEILDSSFLRYLLISKTYKDRLLSTGEEGGSTRQAITKAQLQDFSIDYPVPIAEQQRIVRILDEAFEGIATAKDNAERNLRNARAIFESHLQSVFAKRGKGWAEAQLDTLTDPDSPITYGVVKPGDEGQITFVRGGDLVRGKVRLGQLRTITRAVSDQYRRTLLRGGELLICLVGQPGQVAVAPKELAGANIARQVGLIRLKESMNAEFVRYFLQSAPGVEALGARESGSVQQVINLGELRQVSVPFPRRDVQDEIVEMLHGAGSYTQRLEAVYQRKLAALEALKKSLLHQAFTGKL